MAFSLNRICQLLIKDTKISDPPKHSENDGSVDNGKVFMKYEYPDVFTTQSNNSSLKRKLPDCDDSKITQLWCCSKKRKLSNFTLDEEPQITVNPRLSKQDLVSMQRNLCFDVRNCWLGSYGLNDEEGMSGSFKLMKDGGVFEMNVKFKERMCRVCFSLEALRSFSLSRPLRIFAFTFESVFASCVSRQMKLNIHTFDNRKSSLLNSIVVRFSNQFSDQDVVFLEKMLLTCQKNKRNSLQVNVNWCESEVLSLMDDIGMKRPPKKISGDQTVVDHSQLVIRKSPIKKLSVDIRPLLSAVSAKPDVALSSSPMEIETPHTSNQPVAVSVGAAIPFRGRGTPNPRFRNNIQWESEPCVISNSNPVNKASVSVNRMSSLMLPGKRLPAPNLSPSYSLITATQNSVNLLQPADKINQPSPLAHRPTLYPPISVNYSSRNNIWTPRAVSALPNNKFNIQLSDAPQPISSANHQSNHPPKPELKVAHVAPNKSGNLPYVVIKPNPSTTNSMINNGNTGVSNGVINAFSSCSLVEFSRQSATTIHQSVESRPSNSECLNNKKNQQNQGERASNPNLIDVSSSPSFHSLINNTPILQQNPNIVFTNSTINRFEMVPVSMTPRITEEVIEPFTYKPGDSRDGITLMNEDVMCLNEGNYVNDSIINFYLKYVFHELITPQQRERTHIFNCFFYNKLKDLPPNFPLLADKSPEESESIARHSSVRRWTRNVDIFDKDFIIIPINENSHWFLAIVCYAWMSGTISYTELFQSSNKNTPSSCTDCIKPDYLQDQNTAAKTQFKMRQMERIMTIKHQQRVEPYPCILLFDSLIGTPRSPNVRIIRDYLQVEWLTKRAERDGDLTFDKDTVRGFSPNVPQQPNFSDCGIYVLHYAENFFSSPVLNFTKEYFQKSMSGWFDIETVKGKRAQIQDLIIEKYKQQKKVDELLKIAAGGDNPHLMSSKMDDDGLDSQTITVVKEHIPETKFVPKQENSIVHQSMSVKVQQLVQTSAAAPSIPIMIAPSGGVVTQSSHVSTSSNSYS